MPVKIDMEMPKHCLGCKLNSYYAVSGRYICLPIDCTLTDEEFYAETRPSWCPLKEVKE